MPYRRLPNTDAARLRALENALQKEQNTDMENMAYPYPLKQKIEFFLPKFEAAVKTSKFAKEQQFGNSPTYSSYARKARLYVSHFIQVLNFCIIRGELKPSVRRFYGLNENNSKTPALSNEQDLLEWGEKIIKGEKERLNNREGSPIYSPSIAVVEAKFDDFKDRYFSQKQYQTNTVRERGNVVQLRQEADDIILELWNSIEEHFEVTEDEELRREQCESYGLVYVFRRGEREKLREKYKKQKELERITLKLF